MIDATCRLAGLRAVFPFFVALTAFSLDDARAQKTSSFVISGTVLGLDGGSVRKARLSATSDRPCSAEGREADAEADANGHFQLRVTCAGIWRLSGEAEGYPKQSYEQHDALSTGIVLTSAQPSHEIVFKMIGSSSIGGTVLDEAGEPVRDAKVFLLISGASGEDPMKPIDQTTTDDRGVYEFTDVASGGYTLAVQVQPWYALAAHASRGGGFRMSSNTGNNPSLDPSLDVTYPITFYPAASDAASASTVKVTGGNAQQADFHLAPQPSVHMVLPASGRTNLSAGGSARPLARGGSNPSIQELSAFGTLTFQPTSVSVLADGSIDVGGFAPGDYAIANSRTHENGNQQNFTITKDAGRMLPLSAAVARPKTKQESTGSLSGSIQLQQKPCEGALVLLVPIAGGRMERQQSNTDGSFSFARVFPGKYILIAVDQGWELDWKQPQVLSPFLARGVAIDLDGSIALKVAIEAQSR